MAELDSFTRAYIAALFFTEGGDGELEGYGEDDLSPSALARIVADCERFQRENAADIATIEGQHCSDEYWSGDERAGHDFWLTRNRHGVGFWDRDDLTQDVSERLTNAAHTFGECWATLGDDEFVYIN
jgi:hypothetical protein